MSLMDIAKKANKKITNRFKVTYYDKDTKLFKEEVLETGSEAYDQIMPLAMDKDYDNILGEWVENDTPVGLVGTAKILSVRSGERSYMHVKIHYELKNGVPRFRDFNSVETLGFKIVKHSKTDGDILALELKDNSIEPLDRVDTKNLKHLLSVIQVFNNEVLSEATDDSLDEEDNDYSQYTQNYNSSFEETE